MGLADLVDAIASDLQYIAPTFVGRRYLEREYKPPRYVWTADEDKIGAPTVGFGANPRPLHDRQANVTVHCWAPCGDSTTNLYEPAERLRDALLTSCRKVWLGANFVVGPAEWIEPADAKRGIVVAQHLAILMPLVEQTIPTAGVPGSGVGVAGNLATATDNTHAEADVDRYGITVIETADVDDDT